MNWISRDQWGARDATTQIPTINPSSRTEHWNGPTVWNGSIGSHDSCFSIVRGIQNYHMDHNGWSDIAYNGLVCPHGYLFEGRGYGKRSAANGTNTSNSQSEAFCFIGGESDPYTAESKSVFAELGVTKGHRDWYNTECPGQEIYDWIQTGNPAVEPPSGNVPVPRFDIGDFPLPSNHWYGVPSNDSHNHSGYYWPNDRYGISKVQEALSRIGRPCSIDGLYGNATAGVIKQFQADATATGFDTGGIDRLCGQKTWDVLRLLSTG